MKSIFIVIFSCFLILLTGCAQRDLDAISDLTYVLTGVPGAKHKNNGNNASNTNNTSNSGDLFKNSPFEPSKPDPKTEAKWAKNKKAFNENRDYWVGKSIDDLVMKWNAPDSTYNRTDGGKQYSWTWTQVVRGFPSYSVQCTTNFISNKKGTITEWNYSGCLPHLYE